MTKVERSAESLWQDYLFLTREMLKFISRREMEMFYSLLTQRDELQRLLEETPDNGFCKSPAGQELLKQTVMLNRAVSERLQLAYNQACRQQEINQTYEGTAMQELRRIDFQG